MLLVSEQGRRMQAWHTGRGTKQVMQTKQVTMTAPLPHPPPTSGHA